MTIETEARNTDLAQLADLLRTQQAHKLDLVVPAGDLVARDGMIHIAGAAMLPDPDQGISVGSPLFRPSRIAEEHLADKLGIPLAYLRKLSQPEGRVDLWDANINGWLRGTPHYPYDAPIAAPDGRNFLVRCFRGDDPAEPGIMRALLSDTYMRVENLDLLLAVLEAVREAGVAVQVAGCDLSERRMYVKLAAPEVQALAPILLKGYRNPFADPEENRKRNRGWTLGQARRAAAHEGQGFAPGEEPIVFAGFEVQNSEVGEGAFQLAPVITLQPCLNGLTITQDVMRRVHLGSRLEAGVVRWSDETQRRNLELVKSQTADAVRTFIDADYVQAIVDRLEAKAENRVEDPAKAVRMIAKQCSFTEEQQEGILRHFTMGGQANAAGILNAVTSYSQIIPDADEANRVNAQALRAFEMAAG